MFGAIAKMILKSRINEENATRQKKFMPWDKIEKIALVIEKKDSLNKSSVDQFIENSKKYIEVFYIETSSKNRSYTDWHCFSRKDKSFLNLPGKKLESELKNKKFDVVINTCAETNLFAYALTSNLPAYLKCGGNSRFNLADLVIKKTEPFNLKNYLDETVKYLKMIRV